MPDPTSESDREAALTKARETIHAYLTDVALNRQVATRIITDIEVAARAAGRAEVEEALRALVDAMERHKMPIETMPEWAKASALLSDGTDGGEQP